jgi:hypothetical protein
MLTVMTQKASNVCVITRPMRKMIWVNGIWEQETELVQLYIMQNISLICD